MEAVGRPEAGDDAFGAVGVAFRAEVRRAAGGFTVADVLADGWGFGVALGGGRSGTVKITLSGVVRWGPEVKHRVSPIPAARAPETSSGSERPS
ncbi:hypothetical protein GCM10018987_11130 [Streptomyces cremeus]